MSTLINICNVKGGTGKTSVCINISAELSMMGYKVLIIDNDSQSSVTSILLHEEEGFEYTLYDLYKDKDCKVTDCIYQIRDNLFVLPNTIRSARLEREISQAYQRERRLMNKLKGLPNGFFDFILVDNSPSIGLLTDNSFSASMAFDDAYHLVVLDNSSSSLAGLNMITEVSNELITEGLSKSKLLGVLRNRFDKNSRFTRDFNAVLEDALGDKLLSEILYNSVKYKEAVALHKPIQEHDKERAEPFKTLAKEMLERMNINE